MSKKTAAAKSPGKFFSGWIEPELHRRLKIQAAKSERTLTREINFRLKRSFEQDKLQQKEATR